MKTNNDTLNAIQTMVNNAVDNAGYNSTRSAIIVSRNSNNTYNIKMDGVDYENVVCYGCGILLAGEVVKVIIPNGQASQMFVLAINPYPVGSIYQTTDASFDPNVVWGGTWQKIEGKVLVGLDADDTDFDTVGETGGNKGMFAHTHGNKSLVGYVCNLAYQSNSVDVHASGICSAWSPHSQGTGYAVNSKTTDDGFIINASHEHDSVGDLANDNADIANMPPYEVVVIWKRTA